MLQSFLILYFGCKDNNNIPYSQICEHFFDDFAF
jgi:hypothetical protein